jgi:hypothetical protein
MARVLQNIRQAAAGAPIGIIRPVASVPKPTSTIEGAAPQIARSTAGMTVEDRLSALEADMEKLKRGGAAGSVAELTQRLDDAGLLREQPAKAAAPGSESQG